MGAVLTSLRTFVHADGDVDAAEFREDEPVVELLGAAALRQYPDLKGDIAWRCRSEGQVLAAPSPAAALMLRWRDRSCGDSRKSADYLRVPGRP